MAIKNKKGDWLDHQGDWIPAKVIPKRTKRRDRTVSAIMKKVLKEQDRLDALKKDIEQRIRAYMNYKDFSPRTKDGKSWRGNLTLTNFDRTEQVECKVSRSLALNDNVNTALQLIGDCIGHWRQSGANESLCVIAQKATQVDSKNRVNVRELLSMTQWNIRDPKWQRAMQLIVAAVFEDSSVVYYQFRRRDSAEDNWQQVSLNFSRL